MALTSRIEEYNDKWPDLYLQESSALHKVLADTAIEIHHVGSTAIPGMWAKPEIDILVVAPSLSDLQSFTSKLESLGYDFRGEETDA